MDFASEDIRPLAIALEGDADPARAALWLRGQPRPVALSGRWGGGGTILSSHPLFLASPDDDPFELVQRPGPTTPSSSAGTPLIGGGWFGWWGFGLGSRLERLPPRPPGIDGLDAFDLAFHDHLVRCDARGRWWFEALWSRPRDGFLADRLEWWRSRLEGSRTPDSRGFSAGSLSVSGAGALGHRAAVAEAIERIAAGEMSQANICLTLDATFSGDPLDLWVTGTRALSPDFAAFVGGAGHTVASLSPELFLRRDGDLVHSHPIKGTAPITSSPADLANSPKDRAENVMIVDLMRNDLGKVCRYGSVVVPALCEVHPAAGVWHLVSTVEGRLRPGVGDGDLLRATFPPGSVTGAPKVQASRVIHALEGRAREAYCGAIGFISPLHGLELNVAIRTFEIADGQLWIGAGGGIVSDSSPDAELAEALAKAAGVAAAVGIRIDDQPEPPPPASLRMPAIVRRPRPDPTAGVIETLRVDGDRPVAADEHLARLAQSCRVLRLPLSGDLRSELHAVADGAGRAGVTIRVDRSGTTLTVRELPPAAPVRLVPYRLPGGLGRHKWADRRLIDELSAGGCVPLFCDIDGTVLEAGHAAAAIVRGRQLIVPPLDGRILPSVSRRDLADRARELGLQVTTASFTLGEARAADAIVLSSSLRGPHVGLLDGGPDERSAAALCARLRSAPIR